MKNFLPVLMLCGLGLLLVACGGDAATAAATDAEETSAAPTVMEAAVAGNFGAAFNATEVLAADQLL
ncbi:MAG: DUF4920 domain-containing protein, partial [Bacteroidota bacterium]